MSHVMRKQVFEALRPDLIQTSLYSHRRLEARNFGLKKKRGCTICVLGLCFFFCKTSVFHLQNSSFSFANFSFSFAKLQFSHDVALMYPPCSVMAN